MKCNICKKYDFNTEQCSECTFEYDEDLYWNNDDEWDILNLDDDLEWGHLQLQYRLDSKDIQCLYTDMWTDNNLAYIIGCNERTYKIADALHVHEECIYNDSEKGWIIINLFMEKYLRGYDLEKEIKR